MSVVLDAPVAAAWVFADERTAASQALLKRASTRGAVVPSLLLLELANVLTLSEMRGRVSAGLSVEFFRQLRRMPLVIREPTLEDVAGPILELARSQSLTAYDAVYLWLARAESLPLATRDARLITAAARLGVEIEQA